MPTRRDNSPSQGVPKNALSHTLENSLLRLPNQSPKKLDLSCFLDPESHELTHHIRRRSPGLLWGPDQEYKKNLSLEESLTKKPDVYFNASREMLAYFNRHVGLSLEFLKESFEKEGGFCQSKIEIGLPSPTCAWDMAWINNRIHDDLLGIRLNGKLPNGSKATAIHFFDLTTFEAFGASMAVHPKKAQGQYLGSAMRRFFLKLCDHMDMQSSAIIATHIGSYFNAFDYLPLPDSYASLRANIFQHPMWTHPTTVYNTASDQKALQETKEILLQSKYPKDLKKFALSREPKVILYIDNRAKIMSFAKACLIGQNWHGIRNLQNPEIYTWARLRAKDWLDAELISSRH